MGIDPSGAPQNSLVSAAGVHPSSAPTLYNRHTGFFVAGFLLRTAGLYSVAAVACPTFLPFGLLYCLDCQIPSGLFLTALTYSFLRIHLAFTYVWRRLGYKGQLNRFEICLVFQICRCV